MQREDMGASADADRACAPTGLSPASGSQAKPLVPSAVVAREVWRAVVRAALAVAHAQQLRRGYTLDVMAERVGRTPKQLEYWMTVPANLSLSNLSDVCFAMACEPTFALADGRAAFVVEPWPDEYAQAMSTGTAETLQGAQGRSPASAVGAADAPHSHPETHP